MPHRVIVGCIDGAEHSFIEEHGYRNLLQRQHGTAAIPRELYHPELNVPWTPLVWASIMKGRIVTIDEIKHGDGFLCPPPTILDEAPSICIDVPTVSKTWRLKHPEDTLNVRNLAESQLATFHRRRDETLKHIHEPSWQLLMFYLSIADLYGHFWYGHQKIMHRIYTLIDDMIADVKHAAPDAAVIIISDHGMQPLPGHPHGGKHSDHAFYSTTHPTTPPQKVTDFHKTIKTTLFMG